MTEVGMVLSDPFEQGLRKPGFVGHPMPGIQVRLVKPGILFVYTILYNFYIYKYLI